MYVLAPNQQVKKFPYSAAQLVADNPGISYPKLTDVVLAMNDVFRVVETAPSYNPNTQVATHDGCTFNGEQWVLLWSVRDKTEEELAREAADLAARVERQRADAYRTESDPLFFKWQRGEATQQDWLDKVAEIKARIV